MMPKDFKDLLRSLNENGAKYLIIGGHAFSVQAEPRTRVSSSLRPKN